MGLSSLSDLLEAIRFKQGQSKNRVKNWILIFFFVKTKDVQHAGNIFMTPVF